MKFFIVLALTLMALGSLAEKIKGRKSFNLPSNAKLRQINIQQLLQNQNAYEDDEDDVEDSNIESEPLDVAALKPDSSNGRLFFKKFFLLGKQQQQQPPQFFIITRPPTFPTTSSPITSPTTTTNGTSSGTITLTEVRGGDNVFDDDDDDNVNEDENVNVKANAKKEQHTTFKLVKGKGNDQQGLSFLVPSKYMRNFQNKRNSMTVNPSATYNSGSIKVKKIRLNNNGNGIVKRKRSRNPSMRRTIVSPN